MKIKIFNVLWTSFDGGPSPDNNKRTELFLSGCKRAREGNPCPGCFNPELWDDNNFVAEIDPVEAAAHIEKHAPNKYITIVGGEPLDQKEALAVLVKELKDRGFNIILITHYLYEELKDLPDDEYIKSILEMTDIIIDGKYNESKRIYDYTLKDGIHNVIGSANQRVWILEEPEIHRGFSAGEILSFKILDKDGLTLKVESEKEGVIYGNKEI